MPELTSLATMLQKNIGWRMRCDLGAEKIRYPIMNQPE
jgi:hypothetical protein